MRSRIAKAELQDLHAGNTEPFPQIIDLLRDQPQVFSDERQIAHAGGLFLRSTGLSSSAYKDQLD